MRKIDPHEYMRFMKAMKLLTKEMNKLQQKAAAGEIAKQGNELKAIYKKHRQLVKQLEKNTELYYDTFSRAHSTYRETARQKTRIKAKASKAAKRSTKTAGSR